MISLRWIRRIVPDRRLWYYGIIAALVMTVPIMSPAAAQSSRSSGIATGAYSERDLEIIQRCKQQIFDARGVPEGARNNPHILRSMRVTHAIRQCDENLPHTMDSFISGQDAESVSLIVAEPVCENCSLNIGLYCKNSIKDPAGLTGTGIVYAEPGPAHASYGWIIRPFIETLGAKPVVASPEEWPNAFQPVDTSCIAHLNIGDMPASEVQWKRPNGEPKMRKGEPTVFGMHADISPSEAYALMEPATYSLSWRRLGVDATCSRDIFLLAENTASKNPRTLTGQHPFIAVYEDTISASGRRPDAEFYCSEIKFRGDKVYNMQCSRLTASRSEFMAYVNAAREPDSLTSDNNGALASWECSPGASAGTCKMSLSYNHMQRRLVLDVSRDLEFNYAVAAEQEEKAGQACGTAHHTWGAPAASAAAKPPVATAQPQPADTPVVEAPPRPEPARIAATDQERELEQVCIGNNNSWFQRDCACAVERFRTTSAEIQQRSVHNFLADLKGCMNEAAVRDELTQYCGKLNDTRARANQIGGGTGPQTPLTDCGCYSAELGDWIIANNVTHHKAFGRKSTEIAVQCR